MKSYLVIGAPGTGKTPFVVRLLKGNRCCVFDVMNEYGQRTKYIGQTPVNLSDNIRDYRCRITSGDVEEFMDIVSRKRKTVCVFEEATAFFEGRLSRQTRSLIINRAHTGNVYVFLFHSISSVPPRLMEMTNFVILYPTADEDHTVERKYPRLYRYYKYLRTKHAKPYVRIKVL